MVHHDEINVAVALATPLCRAFCVACRRIAGLSGGCQELE
jgi:poly(3-hydroxybutyrate) depolymerase